MANVTIDSRGTYSAINTAASPVTFTGLTISGGLTNSALIVTLAWRIKTVSVTSVTWNGVSLALINSLQSAGTLGMVQLWGMVNPAAGNNNLVITWTGGASNLIIDAESWSNVDQTGGVTSFPNSTTNSGTSITSTITINTTTGNACVALHCNTSDDAITALSNTTLYINSAGPLFPESGANDNNGSSGASQTLTATWTSGSTNWLAVGTDIKAFAAIGDTFGADQVQLLMM